MISELSAASVRCKGGGSRQQDGQVGKYEHCQTSLHRSSCWNIRSSISNQGRCLLSHKARKADCPILRGQKMTARHGIQAVVKETNARSNERWSERSAHRCPDGLSTHSPKTHLPILRSGRTEHRPPGFVRAPGSIDVGAEELRRRPADRLGEISSIRPRPNRRHWQGSQRAAEARPTSMPPESRPPRVSGEHVP